MTHDPWKNAGLKVDEDLAAAAPLPSGGPTQGEHRFRPRTPFPCRALVCREADPAEALGVYCRDISQAGVALFAPRHALPLEQAELCLHDGRKLPVRVRHCKRIGPRCFLWGCDFETDAGGGPLAVYAEELDTIGLPQAGGCSATEGRIRG